MDLRSLIKDPKQIARAREIVGKGLLHYQPFIFADDLETGAGYEFEYGESKGLVYDPAHDRSTFAEDDELRRWFIDGREKDTFSAANQRLRDRYDTVIDGICAGLGDISGMSFADIGCNSGYFPFSLARRGAAEAVGYDRGDYAESFSLLNSILGTDVKFHRQFYHSTTQSVRGCSSTHDVVLASTVLCHLSDPLQFLACLGSLARKAIFIYTEVTVEDQYCIRFGEHNKYYKDDPFPLCFDYGTTVSLKLLLKSFELMGFSEIYDIGSRIGHPATSAALLAMRP